MTIKRDWLYDLKLTFYRNRRILLRLLGRKLLCWFHKYWWRIKNKNPKEQNSTSGSIPSTEFELLLGASSWSSSGDWRKYSINFISQNMGVSRLQERQDRFEHQNTFLGSHWGSFGFPGWLGSFKLGWEEKSGLEDGRRGQGMRGRESLAGSWKERERERERGKLLFSNTGGHLLCVGYSWRWSAALGGIKHDRGRERGS